MVQTEERLSVMEKLRYCGYKCSECPYNIENKRNRRYWEYKNIRNILSEIFY